MSLPEIWKRRWIRLFKGTSRVYTSWSGENAIEGPGIGLSLYDEEIFFGLRDGNYEKPDGTELLIEFAKDVCSRVKKKDTEAMNDVLFLLDIIFTLMEFAAETEWTYPLASEMRNIIVS